MSIDPPAVRRTTQGMWQPPVRLAAGVGARVSAVPRASSEIAPAAGKRPVVALAVPVEQPSLLEPADAACPEIRKEALADLAHGEGLARPQ
jgi:hypothetical protein